MAGKTPKGKTPSLIGSSNGRPERSIAQRKCKCARCNRELMKNDICFDIPKLGQAFTSSKRFCRICYEQVLEQTEKDLNQLKQNI